MKLIAAILLLAATLPTNVQKTVAQLDAKGGKLEHSVWGILAVNFKGDTLAQLNQGRCMVPASNMKLITTAGAYLKLGRGYTFKTQLATDGEIRDTTLFGNLYVIGGGDPLIGNLFTYLPKEDIPFGKWRKVLEDKGIRRIEGDIVGDGSYFSGERRHTDWSTEDERSKDGVVPAGLTWRGKMGDSIPDGPLAAATHFRRWLVANGIVVTGGAGENTVDSLTTLGIAQSASLNHIATIANHQSDNFCAETLLKAIGKANNGSDDYDTATAALHRALSPIGLAGPSAGMRFADGSGLSRKNYVSPEFLVRLLTGMAKTGVYKDYLGSLPRPGRKDGTLQTRLPKAPAAVKNRIYMKSGSMNGVRCFSGYILPSDGDTRKTIAFSIMVNNFVGKQSELAPVLDNLILELANEN
ncbi:MAG: D-alanyl-D-alanine carboxypeptidase [Bacteroidales bacterium]|nr:D-alanyl-D-alanine carboxypeptidase [Bacteroidales bacterium]